MLTLFYDVCVMLIAYCRREVVDEFMKIIGGMKKCENCGAFSPALRKDGYSKLFQKPLNDKALKHNEVCDGTIIICTSELVMSSACVAKLCCVSPMRITFMHHSRM
jgi:hypothetical protein